MPVTGIPDGQVHRFCLYCHKWHFPEEGKMLLPSGGPLGDIGNLGRVLTGDESVYKFACFRCLNRRRLVRVVIFAALAVLVVIALVLKALGFVR